MRTLFAKILVWYLATILVIVIALTVVERTRVVPQQGPQGHLAAYLAGEAYPIYMAEGREGLASYLKRFQSGYGSKAFLLDPSGRDLVSSVDRSHLIRSADRAIHETKLPWFPSQQTDRGFVWASDRNGNWLFLETVPPGSASSEWLKRWMFAPQRLWLLVAALPLCYLLTCYLTKPIRDLERAARRFGDGDLTERLHSRRRDQLGQLARTFDGMAEHIQTLLENQRTLLRDISHELRSPLTRLSLAIELARSGSDTDRALDRIEKEADRLNILVGQLLSLAALESRKSIQPMPVRLDEMLNDLVDVCSLEASSRNCRLQLRCDGPMTIEADEELLRRAIENAVCNALRYAPAGTDIIVTATESPDSTYIRVRDFGPGVPPEALSRLFDPLFRVDQDRSRDTGGAGLGLAIARHAVRVHSGEVSARNVHPGLELEIRLPLSHRSSEHAKSEPQLVQV